MAKEKYTIRTTDGETFDYTYKEIFQIVENYIMKRDGRVCVDSSDVDEEIPMFIRRFLKKV